jgi:uncharacterized membrane protein YebE (DUF533 family)
MDELTRIKLRDVLVLALADKRIGDSEKQFINDLRLAMGVGDEEFKGLLAEVRARPDGIALPADKGQLAGLFALLVQAAAADGEISSQKVEMLQQMAQTAALDEQVLNDLLGKAQQEQALREGQVEQLLEDIYLNFGAWDESQRRRKIDQFGQYGSLSVIPLLRLLESYRVPDNMPDNMEMKVMVANKLGQLQDQRAAYYLAQQVIIGNMDDEVTNQAFRFAAAEALGKVAGRDFTADQAGVEAARQWWFSEGLRTYDKLVI